MLIEVQMTYVCVLGCGHCKKAKPEFMDAAKHDADNNKARKLSTFLFDL